MGQQINTNEAQMKNQIFEIICGNLLTENERLC